MRLSNTEYLLCVKHNSDYYAEINKMWLLSASWWRDGGVKMEEVTTLFSKKNDGISPKKPRSDDQEQDKHLLASAK